MRSNCCNEPVIENSDMCSKCKEHSEIKQEVLKCNNNNCIEHKHGNCLRAIEHKKIDVYDELICRGYNYVTMTGFIKTGEETINIEESKRLILTDESEYITPRSNKVACELFLIVDKGY